MAEAIVSTILEHLTSLAIEKASEAWSLVKGVEEEVKRLESNFEALRYELEDAEERQYVDKRVKHWLDRFTQVSYDMEDVLEDWKIAFHKLQTSGGDGGDFETGSTSSKFSPNCWKLKVPSFLSCFSSGSHVVSRYGIASRIKEINEQVDQIVKDRDKFGFVRRELRQPPKRQDSTSFADMSKLHGRDSVKEDIIGALLGEVGTSGEVVTNCNIAIVGIGGLGKTALAQMVYNDRRIQTHFHHKIWVCVSDPFDQIQIAIAILGVLDPNSSHTHNANPKLQSLLEEIGRRIEGKKFFLVLDDVWTERSQDWEPFKVAFMSGLSGSRILVTTRKETVAGSMDVSRIIHLNQLSDEICWLILKQMAISGSNKDGKKFEDIGRKIAKKCKGLPLVAKSLGGVLQNKLRHEDWQKVLNSEIWKLELAEKDIFAPLLLSYYELPPKIRRCLLYCAIFPKDYGIRRNELIRHWMAQGYLNSDDENSPSIDKGEEYFDCLAAGSFFQNFSKDSRGRILCCEMHDVIHDFLLFLTKFEFVEKEVKFAEDLTLDLSSKKARHMRLVIAEGIDFPTSISGLERLRSLGIIVRSNVTSEALSSLFSVTKRLRLLDFSLGGWDYAVGEEIPDEIGKLIHLRYLSLQNSRIKKLPRSISQLCNLETLDLKFCDSLETLPDGIGKLINLRYLYTEGCKSLTYYPKGVGKLTSLVGLTDIIVRVDRNDTKEFSIGDFENLKLLHGDLYVDLAGVGAIDLKEVKRAKLHDKEHLKRLHIKTFDGDDVEKHHIVQALNPPISNLQVTFGDNRRLRHAVLVSQAALQFIQGYQMQRQPVCC